MKLADEIMYAIEQVHTFHCVDRYDCAGRKIRFHWVIDSTSLGGRVNFVG